MGSRPKAPRRRGALLLTVVALALAVASCGGDDDPQTADRDAIEGVLAELRSAQDSGDAEAACRDVYVIQEPGRGGGASGEAAAEAEAEAEAEAGAGDASGGCEAAFRAADERRRREVRDLATEVGSIEIDGDEATAIVHTELRRADGSPLSQDVPYDLVRTPEGWRVRISEEG